MEKHTSQTSTSRNPVKKRFMRRIHQLYFLIRAAFFGTGREATLLLAVVFMIGALGALVMITLIDAIKLALTIGGAN